MEEKMLLFLSAMCGDRDVKLFVGCSCQGWFAWDGIKQTHVAVSMREMLNEWGYSIVEVRETLKSFNNFYVQDWETFYHILHQIKE